MKKQESYGIDESNLSNDYIKITPKLGELIIFNPMRIHSVKEIKEGNRLTWSCFIGYSNSKEPLQIWS